VVAADPNAAQPGAGGRKWELFQWAFAGAILLVEYLLVSLRFDAATVARRGGVWALAGSFGTIAPLAVVSATALLVLKRSRGTELLPAAPGRPALRLLGAHAVLFAAFWLVTAVVFGGEAAPRGMPTLWLGLWLGVGAGSAITLLMAIVGSGRLRAALSASLAIGLGVGIAAWVAGLLTTLLWVPLTRATLSLSVGLLRPWFPEVIVDFKASELTLDAFSVGVAPICSGLEGIGLVTVLMLGFLVTFRDELRFPRALLLLPLGIAGVWLSNGVRVAGLLVLGARVDQDLAMGAFHSKAGWVLFCVVALTLTTIARRTRFFAKQVIADDIENPTAAYLMPVLAVIGTGLLTGTFAAGVDELYGLRILAAFGVLYAYSGYYRELERRVGALSVLVGVLIGVLWIATARTPEPDAGDVSALWIAARVIGSVLVAPITEELAFRGFLLRRLVDRDFTTVSFRAWTPLAVLGSSLAFAAVHERWLIALFTGVVYAVVQLRSGRLSDAVAAHAASNVVICVWVLATGERWHW
jgi:exosortase E/protease (VPEID-CTERM system)